VPKSSLLNVKKQLEYTNSVIESICKETMISKPGGVSLPPLFHSELQKIKLINECILRKHALKKTRKDLQF
jgi:hypothetical protein